MWSNVSESAVAAAAAAAVVVVNGAAHDQGPRPALIASVDLVKYVSHLCLTACLQNGIIAHGDSTSRWFLFSPLFLVCHRHVELLTFL